MIGPGDNTSPYRILQGIDNGLNKIRIILYYGGLEPTLKYIALSRMSLN